MKDEVNSIKQQNSGVGRRGNTVRKAVWKTISDFDGFIDENAVTDEDDNDFASAGKESNLDRIGLGGMSIFMAWGIMKIWTGT
jgi:hypothetical protein